MNNAVSGGVRFTLRVEAFFIFVAALFMYGKYGLGWKFFAIYFLFPDISFAAYFFGKKVGAIAYNCAHSYVLPSILLILSTLYTSAYLLPIAIIWFAHIGADRTLGYGLKYYTGFTYTHLGEIGRKNQPA